MTVPACYGSDGLPRGIRAQLVHIQLPRSHLFLQTCEELGRGRFPAGQRLGPTTPLAARNSESPTWEQSQRRGLFSMVDTREEPSRSRPGAKARNMRTCRVALHTGCMLAFALPGNSTAQTSPCHGRTAQSRSCLRTAGPGGRSARRSLGRRSSPS